MDIATGTGIWAMEFGKLSRKASRFVCVLSISIAQQYPDSKVIGVDLSKIQPKNAPPNVEFIKDDSEEPWVFPYKFDFVHARAVFTCFNDQKAVMRNAFENLNEGGWIEYLDGSFIVGCLDGTIEGISRPGITKLSILTIVSRHSSEKMGRAPRRGRFGSRPRS